MIVLLLIILALNLCIILRLAIIYGRIIESNCTHDCDQGRNCTCCNKDEKEAL